MPRIKSSSGRGVGPVGLVLTLLGIGRRIPVSQRRRLVAEARRHGPRLAKQAYGKRRRGPRAR